MILNINSSRYKINKKLLELAVEVFAKKFKISQDTSVSLALVSGSRIQQLNKKYRGYDKVTDILSFTDDDDSELGELVVCLEQIKIQAQDRKVSVDKELVFIFIHGLLHLVGHEDETEKGHNKMLKLGDALCKSILGSVS